MDNIEKRMEEIRARWAGNQPFRRFSVDSMYDAVREFRDWADDDIDWLLTRLEASRQECERLRVALMDARRDEGYP